MEIRPTERAKGEELLRLVRVGESVDARNFKHADCERMVFQGPGGAPASLRGARITKANFDGADLRGTSLEQACFDSSNMRGADFSDVAARCASFDHCDLTGARFVGSDLTNTSWVGAVRTAAVFDSATYRRSNWGSTQLVEWTRAGARVEDRANLPEDARLALMLAGFHGRAGLTLTFDSRLHRFDPAAFTALVLEVLGPETDVGIEEQSRPGRQPGFIRINGSDPDDLAVVVEAFYDRAWRGLEAIVNERAEARAMSTGIATVLAALERQRDHFVRLEANVEHLRAGTALLADDDVREAIMDKAAEHVLAKRKTSFQTTFQRIAEGLAKEVPKKLIGAFIGEKAADALGEVLGGVAETVVDETMDVLQDPVDDEADE